MATEGAKCTQFSLQVDMPCRCTDCVEKIDKAMASIITFTGVETTVRNLHTGVVTVTGKANPAELCQWLHRETMEDVKIVRPHPPPHNCNNQIMIPGSRGTTPSAPLLPRRHLSRDALMIRSLKNELAAAQSELRQSREVIRNTKNALLDSAVNQLNAIKKL